jgi:ubiquitin carboxyl-terminal hydrolase 22/27/51
MTSISAKKSVPTKTAPGKSIPKKSPPSSYTSVSQSTNSSPKKESNDNNNSTNNPISELDAIDSYLTLPSCIHLTKVLNSNSKDAVLKTYGAGMNIVIVGLHSNRLNENKKQLTSFSIKNNSSLKYFNRKGEKINIHALKKARSNILHCKDCSESHSKQHNNLYMCLQCTNIGCWSEKHAYSHAKKSGHVFGKFLINIQLGKFIKESFYYCCYYYYINLEY